MVEENNVTYGVHKNAVIISLFLNILFIYLERGEGKEKERERNFNVWLPFTYPPLGTWPATQACALTGNRTSDPLVCRPMLIPLSYTSQGSSLIINQTYPPTKKNHVFMKLHRKCLVKLESMTEPRKGPG